MLSGLKNFIFCHFHECIKYIVVIFTCLMTSNNSVAFSFLSLILNLCLFLLFLSPLSLCVCMCVWVCSLIFSCHYYSIIFSLTTYVSRRSGEGIGDWCVYPGWHVEILCGKKWIKSSKTRDIALSQAFCISHSETVMVSSR